MGRILRTVRLVSVLAVSIASIVVLMLLLTGYWTDKTPPGPPAEPHRPASAGLPMMTVSPVQVPLVNEAVGAIRAEHEVSLSSRLPMPAEIAVINASPGDVVLPGQLLVKLNDSQLVAQLAQAEANLAMAKYENERIARLSSQGQASPREVTAASSAFAAAQAKCDEIRTLLGYTEIRAPGGATTQPATQPDWPEDAPRRWVVINRYAEAGDTVQPGQPLVRLFDRLQLIAVVPESLRQHIEVGQAVSVHIDALGRQCAGRISEIIPQASEQSRSFQVKVTGPCQGGVIVGMFARMSVPTGQRETELRVPLTAVRRTGQLTTVFVERDGRLVRQFVQLGRTVGDSVVVSSGLAGGDRIVVDAASVASE